MKKIAKRFFSVAIVLAIVLSNFSPLMPMMKVKASSVIDEISIKSERTLVGVGELPTYVATTTTEHASVQAYGSNTNWTKWEDGASSWSGFGSDTPTALEGETHYALRLCVELDDGYEFANDTRVIFNGNDVTSRWNTMVSKFSWGGYVYIDLGPAWNEPLYRITYDFNGGNRFGDSTLVNYQVSYGPYISVENFIDSMHVTAPTGKELDALEINGVRYEIGSGYMQGSDTTYKYLWKDSGTSTDPADNVTVTFDANGGDPVASQTIEKDTKASMPAQPTRSGYAFSGWSKDAAIINENTGEMEDEKSLFDFDTAIGENTTLVANWKKIYTVTFDSGTVLPDELKPVTVQVEAGDVPEYPKSPNGDYIPDEYNGYEIVGFYTDSNFTEPYYGEPITSDVTIYIEWDEISLEDAEEINNVEITLTPPEVGTEIYLEEDEDVDTQRPQANITLPTGANYILDEGFEGNLNYMYWVKTPDVDANLSTNIFTGTIEKDGKYYALVYLRANDGYVFSYSDLTIKANGQTIDPELIDTDGDIVCFIVEVTPDENGYKILDGANQTMTVDSMSDLTVRANGDLANLTDIKVDGKSLPEKYRRLTEGSTILTIDKDYLKTLSPGVHKLTFVYNDGEVSTNFTITKTEATTNNPKTLDPTYMWISLLTISALGLVTTSFKFRKLNER